MRKFVHELTVANVVSLSRIPFILVSLSVAKDNPYLLAGLLGAAHSLDASDGYAARKGLGNSPLGPMIDIAADHIIEIYTAFKFAKQYEQVPNASPWIFTARDASVDFLRLYNGITRGFSRETHPHEDFGTVGTDGHFRRGLYGGIKALGDITIPIAPQLGLAITATHIAASLERALPVWTSP